jgi:tetratricopeptide (TPR) repeat protein
MDGAISAVGGQRLNKYLAMPMVQNEFSTQMHNAGLPMAERPAADLVVRVVPVEWSYTFDQAVPGPSGSGRLEISLEVRNARDPNAAPLYRETYWAKAHVNKLGEPEAMLRASQRVAGRFLRDLQPNRISEEVVLDDDDEGVKVGVDLCKENHFDAAYSAFFDAVQRSPSSAPALYDLGVLTEARGDYDQAEELINRAIAIKPKKIYYRALERVHRAHRDADDLQKQ